ncbi:HupE/UreJ family protein [Ectobacillus funiculus]|uniref:HupE/UreJ family protein n=1 Tax=Ectobacillus funiculus TaxID=137993 RepID=UPI00397C84A4
MKKQWIPILLILLTFHYFFSSSASAHTSNSEGFSTIEVKGKTLQYELKLDLTELGHAMNKEISQQQSINSDVLQKYLNSHIKLYADGVLIEGIVKKTDVETIKDRQFGVINLTYEMDHAPGRLVLNYNIFLDDSDPSHANFVTVKMNGKQQEKILSYEARELEIGEIGFLQNVKQFLLLGLKHIFTGYDHILFVISLLFGAKTIRHIFSLVTAFTIAHSITLALATLQIVQLPSKLIESAIALSIIYVALINIFDQNSKHQPWIAFCFGLIHGFGFAGILSEMRLDESHMVTSLLSFNIGIEIGQLLIVSLVFPLIRLIKKTRPANWLIPGTSVGILAFGLLWFFQRAF